MSSNDDQVLKRIENFFELYELTLALRSREEAIEELKSTVVFFSRESTELIYLDHAIRDFDNEKDEEALENVKALRDLVEGGN